MDVIRHLQYAGLEVGNRSKKKSGSARRRAFGSRMGTILQRLAEYDQSGAVDGARGDD
jgi:hypothetical protein